MYLSKLVLNPSCATRYWLKNTYEVHQRVKAALPKDPRPLYRIEWDRDGEASILVQSFEQRPDWARAFSDLPVLARYQYKPYDPRFIANSWLAFRLRANPTGCRQGVRYPLVREADQSAWLARKMAAAGVEVYQCAIVGRERQATWKDMPDDGRVRMSHLGVTFEGILKVTDPGLLAKAVRSGIGPAKGLGFGLLSVMPAV